jgi:L-alanine-DL-glutamate epimerase-like enolase superfamily enzyme
MIDGVDTRVLVVPTDGPESDGTFEWDSTTVVLVTVHAGDLAGLGYTYGPAAVASVVDGQLADEVVGGDPLDVSSCWAAMRAAMRNAGQAGIGALAVSAVDVALHDLRARRVGLPLTAALGRVRDRIEAYGSGGFCTYGPAQVAEQLGAWASEGRRRVKMKVGRDPAADLDRLRAAREAIGPGVELMVDANGAFDVDGLHRVRDAVGAMHVAAGEYCWSALDARRLLEAGAVDVLQLDVTRCGGITGTLRAEALAQAHNVPTSLHCAPALAAHVACAMPSALHVEDFHDHRRIEAMLFDDVPVREGPDLVPGTGSAGHGLRVREQEAARFEAPA